MLAKVRCTLMSWCLIFVETFCQRTEILLCRTMNKTVGCILDQVESFWWIAAVARRVCIRLITAACMYHEGMGNDPLLVDFNVVEKAVHVWGQGLKPYHELQCDKNVFDCRVKSVNMPKAFIANPSVMPLVNVTFLGHCTLVKLFRLESIHLNAWLTTPMMKASELNGGKKHSLMPDATVEAKLHRCCLVLNCSLW